MTGGRRLLFQQLMVSVHMNLSLQSASGIMPTDKADPALVLLDSLLKSRFRFEAETWHDAHNRNGQQHYPAELLLRATAADGQAIKPLAPITTISEAGLQAQFDKALILAGIHQALEEGLMPVSINTSARNIASADFWRGISQMLRDNFSPEEIDGQITFEVLEDDLANNPCREVLLAMKRDMGCRFAIDDFYHDRARHIEDNDGIDSHDWTRLENLKGIIDYVKIDGETVEAALNRQNRFDLEGLVNRIKTVVPQAHIILERIKDADQAHALSHVADAVQGLHLTKNRADFQRDLVDAKHNFPPRPIEAKLF